MESYLELARKTSSVALEAGKYIRDEAKGFRSEAIRSKGTNDFVSYVDLEAEKLIVAGLGSILPQAGFLTEEGTAVGAENDLIWIVDPLDGTTNFMHGLPPYSVSIALQEKNRVVIGVVYEICSGEMFWAARNEGAWLNEEKISVSSNAVLSKSLVGTGFPYKDYGRLATYLDTLEYMIRNTRGVRRQGSAAVDLAHIACGRLDAFFEYNLNPWDVSAGTLIIREAGGRVSDFRGNEQNITGKEIIAANNLVYLEFQEAVKARLIDR